MVATKLYVVGLARTIQCMMRGLSFRAYSHGLAGAWESGMRDSSIHVRV